MTTLTAAERAEFVQMLGLFGAALARTAHWHSGDPCPPTGPRNAAPRAYSLTSSASLDYRVTSLDRLRCYDAATKRERLRGEAAPDPTPCACRLQSPPALRRHPARCYGRRHGAHPITALRKLEEGRAAFVRDLRTLADELERLPIRDAGEVLAWLSPHLERLRHEADRVFRRT